MIKAYKFRIYPTRQQQKILLTHLEKCREIYNELLAESKSLMLSRRSDFYELVRDMKIAMPKRYVCVYGQVLQNVADRLSKAYANFFRRIGKKKAGDCIKAGFPRFKRKLKSFTFPQFGFRIIDAGRRHQVLKLSKIGDIRVRCHRNLNGKIKTLTIKQSPSGKWFATFAIYTGDSPNRTPIKNANQVVGLDMGIKDFVFDSEGKTVPNPKYFSKHEAKLRSLQRHLSRKKKYSRNFQKARLRVASQHEHIANMRTDFLHKLSHKYVSTYDAISIEDLCISKMIRRSLLPKNILDCGWGIFRQMLFRKAESAGKTVILVNPSMTTQLCSRCGQIVPKTLQERTHHCPYCRLELPRDYNSAITVKKRALKALGMDDPELTPVEMKPLPTRYFGWQASSTKQELCAKESTSATIHCTGSPSCKGENRASCSKRAILRKGEDVTYFGFFRGQEKWHTPCSFSLFI